MELLEQLNYLRMLSQQLLLRWQILLALLTLHMTRFCQLELFASLSKLTERRLGQIGEL
jgi:hypothetical protein